MISGVTPIRCQRRSLRADRTKADELRRIGDLDFDAVVHRLHRR